MSATGPESQIQLWFERRFDFTFPVEQFPNLCVRLRGAPARLEELVRDVPHALMTRRPGDKWSAQEHAGHLADLESLWTARVDDFLVEGKGDTLTIADVTNRKTHDANHNARDVKQILAEFRTGRLSMMEHLARCDPALFGRSRLHPRLKQPMRLVDHLFFVAEHDDHHLARISELVDA